MAKEDLRERALLFECEGEQLVGVLTEPAEAHEIGVIIVVGGPQYRVGSHRQFVLLARQLARNGFPVLRFDYRGMGDSTGAQRTFEAIEADIRAAIDATLQRCPTVARLVLWGLCDGASAAMMYAPTDPRVAGLVLANPWARGVDTLAQTHLKHYYLRRVLSFEFWAKVLRGNLSMRRAAAELGSNIAEATGSSRSDRADYRTLMTKGLDSFRGSALLILSESDLTAQEFLLYMNSSSARRELLSRKGLARLDLQEADHTFSLASVRERVEEETVRWLLAL